MIAYLGLGSNIGDRKKFLHEAVQALYRHEQLQILGVSSLYETEPWGVTDQEPFINLVVSVETALSAMELLELAQEIEIFLHRVRKQKWGPRTIDVDLLWYDDQIIHTERLTIPHPYITVRDFVVIPFAELAPELRLLDKSLAEWATHFDPTKIKKL
jgi:2-amino-4-hydroxy-6-hydroxymethyldihydropteridine diphosphokinase